MALKIDNKLVFLHVPKTGGQWIAKAARAVPLPVEKVGRLHSNYQHTLYNDRLSSGRVLIGVIADLLLKKIGIRHSNDLALPYFCFVRNPFDWYQSLWAFFQEFSKKWAINHDPIAEQPGFVQDYISNACPFYREGFDDYISRILCNLPGQLSSFYHSYVGANTEYLGRTEFLAEDLSTIFQMNGIEFPEEILTKVARHNVSQNKPVWNPELKKSILYTELAAFIQYGYISSEQLSRMGVKSSFTLNKKLVSTKLDCAAIDELID